MNRAKTVLKMKNKRSMDLKIHFSKNKFRLQKHYMNKKRQSMVEGISRISLFQ